MERTQGALLLRVFRLPPRVDAEALQVVKEEMLSGRRDQACLLDFSRTHHIRFQDLQRFAWAVRRGLETARPVLLMGLSDYCERIVLYALQAEDWDRFHLVAEPEATAPGGGTPGVESRWFGGSRHGGGCGIAGLGGVPVAARH